MNETRKAKCRIATLLEVGAENAIRGDKLVTMGGFPDARAMKLQVEAERNMGEVICTSNEGYFLPERGEDGLLTDKGALETLKFYNRQTRKGVSSLRAAQSAKQELLRYNARFQMELSEITEVDGGGKRQ